MAMVEFWLEQWVEGNTAYYLLHRLFCPEAWKRHGAIVVTIVAEFEPKTEDFERWIKDASENTTRQVCGCLREEKIHAH